MAPEPGKQGMQLHLDIEVSDLAAATEHALELGATLAEFQPQDDVRVLLDPAVTRSASTRDVRPLRSPCPTRASSQPPRCDSASTLARARASQCSRAWAVWNSDRLASRSRSTAARPGRNRSSGTWAYSRRTSAMYSA